MKGNYGEPWRAEGPRNKHRGRMWDRHDEQIMEARIKTGHGSYLVLGQQSENLSRAAACVNAMARIKDPEGFMERVEQYLLDHAAGENCADARSLLEEMG